MVECVGVNEPGGGVQRALHVDWRLWSRLQVLCSLYELCTQHQPDTDQGRRSAAVRHVRPPRRLQHSPALDVAIHCHLV